VPAELSHKDLTLAVRENEDSGFAEIGVVVEGAFVAFTGIKLSAFHEALDEARVRTAQEQAEAQQREQDAAQQQAQQPQGEQAQQPQGEQAQPQGEPTPPPPGS
jgi:DNA segregation ATPase FtsK/SpoIIIE-like protein